MAVFHIFLFPVKKFGCSTFKDSRAISFDNYFYYCPLNFLSHDKIRAGTYCRSQP